MRSRCEAFEDAIWDHVRFGTPLSGNTLTHIKGCARCARALEEAGQVTQMVLQADCVPPAPDCRSAVMSRISQPQRVFRPVWAYASAGVALASVAIGGIITISVMDEPASRVAKSAGPAVVVPSVPKGVDTAKAPIEPRDNGIDRTGDTTVPKVPQKPIQIAMAIVDPAPVVPSVPAPEMRKGDSPASDEMMAFTGDMKTAADRFSVAAATAPSFAADRIADYGPDGGSSVVTYDTTAASAGAMESSVEVHLRAKAAYCLAVEAKADAEVVEADRPVAIAVVNWTPPPAPSESTYSYSYTDLDPGTGQLTTCSVERNGDVVNIYLEAKPENTMPSERGSIDNESSTNV